MADTTAIYIVTACTPEDGRVVYETPFFETARRIHSNLMQRQLDPNDFTHDVRVETVWRPN